MRPLKGKMSAEDEAELWYECLTILGYLHDIPKERYPVLMHTAKEIIQLRKEGKEDEINSKMLAVKGD